jgi:hypothetical protein
MAAIMSVVRLGMLMGPVRVDKKKLTYEKSSRVKCYT